MTDTPPEGKLRFLCFGMGAIGSYIGGSLALAGFPVSFVERPESVEKAKANGLSLTLMDGAHSIDTVTVYSSLEEALSTDTYDVVLVAVKSFDTHGVAEKIQTVKEKIPMLLCLQNGVENEAVFEEVLGKDRVLGASICTAISKTGVGRITVEKLRGIGIENTRPLSEKIIRAFCDAGLRASGYPNRDDLKWSKMLSNLLGNATSAILNWTPALVFSDPEIYRIEFRQIHETLTIMNALGIKVVNLPGTPIKPLIQLMDRFPLWLSRPVSYLAMGKGRGAKMPSFHIDLYSGQSHSEVTYLNGAVVRAGNKLGIQTPVNQTLTTTLEALAAGELKKEDFANSPKKLLARIQENL
jgi:2-dehydropantoate 2-reductase